MQKLTYGPYNIHGSMSSLSELLTCRTDSLHFMVQAGFAVVSPGGTAIVSVCDALTMKERVQLDDSTCGFVSRFGRWSRRRR